MARLPDLNDLGARPVPVSNRRVSTVPNAGAVGDAVAGIGQGVTQYAEKRIEQEDRLNYAAAKTALLTEDIAARQELQNDPDYATYEQRYNERMSRARERASGLIASRSDRRLFDVDVQMDMARGLGEVRQLATQKRNAVDFGTGLQTLDDLRGVARAAPDEATRLATIQTANETINGMVAKGLIDPGKAFDLRRGFAEGHVKTRINVKLDEGDVEGARIELEKGGAMLDDDTYIALHHAIDQSAEDNTVMNAATVGMGAADKISGSGDFDRMVEITLGSESGNRRFGKDGMILTSAAGAKGEMQVLDGTNIDPGFGVAPARDASHDERARVGRDYLEAMLTRYGSPDKAWAAYNGGPGRVDEAIEKARKTGKPWLSFMPKETRAYVAKNVAKLQGGVGKPATMEEAISRGIAALGANADPKVVARTRSEISTRWSVQKDAEKERENSVMEAAQQALVNNGGNWYALPATVRASVPAQYHDQMIAFGKSLQEGRTTIKTDPVAYVKLTEQAARDPQAFAKINPISYRNKFDDTDWERLVALRNDILGGEAKGADAVTSMGEIRTVAKAALDAKGLTTDGLTDKKDPKGEKRQAVNARLYRFEKAMAADLAVWQRSNPGKKPSPRDIQEIADRRLLQWNRGEDDPVFAFEVQPGTRGKVSIPTKDVLRLKAVGRRVLGRDPTEQQIVEAYLAEAKGGL